MKIAVVGAGLAGLSVAHILEQKGCTVTIFEAKDRIGGRILSVPTDDGGTREEGGAYVRPFHRRACSLIEHLGLTLVEKSFPKRDPNDDVIKDQSRIRSEAKQLMEDLPPKPWTSPELVELDQTTVASFFEFCCRSEAGLESAMKGFTAGSGQDPTEVSLLGWIDSEKKMAGQSKSLLGVEGGMEGVIKGIAADLHTEPVLNRPMKSIQQSEDHVEIWMEGEMAMADRAVITLPPKVLLDVDFGDSLSMEQELAWQVLGAAGLMRGEIDWRDDQYAKASGPTFPPGAVLAAGDHIGEQAGRIHFAGDAASNWPGLLEGALESAERAAEEVMNADKK
jgi:monoamine oxidase